MKEKVVLIGAGSAMFTRGLVADMLRRKWQGELRLVDVDPEALAVAKGLARKMIQAKRSPLKLSGSTDRRDLLKGATAVICTIGVGGRRAWEQDVYIPRKYGIYQPVGDSVMPGGSARALRMIPAMVGIAWDVLALAPGALFFNYGNPMGPNCRAVRKATGANVIGLCHGVIHIAQHIANLLGVPLDRLKYNAVGMNHLTWFTQVRVEGQDAMPRLRALAREKLRRRINRLSPPGHAGQAASGRGRVRPDESEPFTWELVDLFGAFPAVYDCHIIEFFPHFFHREGSYYGRTPGVNWVNFEERIASGDAIFEEMRQVARSRGPLAKDYFARISGEHEQVIEMIESIRTDAGRVFSVNLPNRGIVPNLPYDAVIECPGIADAGGIRAIAQPPLDSAIAGTLATRFQWAETIVEAALAGSREKFVQALLLDGSVESVPMAHQLADDLLRAHAKYLPQFRRPKQEGRMFCRKPERAERGRPWA
jgi:alpha-galactosidase